MLLQLKNASFAYGSDLILNDVDFEIKAGEKIALIGNNGSGKTTLLKIFASNLKIDKGNLLKSAKLKIGYLNQELISDMNNTVLDELLESFKELIQREKELQLINKQIAENNDLKLIEHYSLLLENFIKDGGYEYQKEIRKVFLGFNFKESDLEKRISSFSGGEKTKIAFIKLLLNNNDLLILDEPTNHLDLKTIRWLESYITKYPKAIIIVSHDRSFINNTCSIIYELFNHKLYKYHGDYEYYLKEKERKYEKDLKLYNYQQKDIKRLEELIDRFRSKSTKAKFAQSKIKYLERMDKLEKPEDINSKSFNLKFKAAKYGAKKVLALEDFTFGYDKVLGCLNLELMKGQRLCLLGDNGSGKSCLLKTIIGKQKAIKGHMLLGSSISVAYYSQDFDFHNLDNNLIEEIYEDYPELKMSELRSLLARFLFTKDDIFKKIKVLSGGEKVRLAFLKLMLRKDNFLILDEPTNHLDIASKEALENALIDYDGTILFVSHDRYFIKKIANSLLILDDGKFSFHSDDYADLLTNSNKKEETNAKVVLQETSNKKPKTKFNLRKIEAEISKYEELLEDKRALRYEEEYYQDNQKMEVLNDEIDEIHNILHNLMKDWEMAMEEKEAK